MLGNDLDFASFILENLVLDPDFEARPVSEEDQRQFFAEELPDNLESYSW